MSIIGPQPWLDSRLGPYDSEVQWFRAVKGGSDRLCVSCRPTDLSWHSIIMPTLREAAWQAKAEARKACNPRPDRDGTGVIIDYAYEGRRVAHSSDVS